MSNIRPHISAYTVFPIDVLFGLYYPLLHICVIIPSANEVERGVLVWLCPSIYLSVCLSAGPSVCPSMPLWNKLCPLCISYNAIHINFIFTHPINQLQEVCCISSLCLISKIWIFAELLYFRVASVALEQLYNFHCQPRLQRPFDWNQFNIYPTLPCPIDV